MNTKRDFTELLSELNILGAEAQAMQRPVSGGIPLRPLGRTGEWVSLIGLGGYDAVYCFLSPAPMAGLWTKARAEMRPGSLLVSNSFDIPGVPADEVIEMHDWRASRLLLWRL